VTVSPSLPVQLPFGLIHVGGVWRKPQDGRERVVINPATEEEIGCIGLAEAADVDEAVIAARVQFETGEWSRMSGADRGRLLWKLADLIEQDRATLAHLEALDIGRPYFEPFAFEIPLAADTFRHFAGWADKLEGSTFSLPPFAGRDRFSYTLRLPMGLVGVITPWNAPTMIAAWKLATALAAGNTVVIKPAEDASLSTMRLMQLIEQADFPPGVVNLVTGEGGVAGEAIVEHPGVDKISFTGSTAVGRNVAAKASIALKKLTLELGGKSPQILRRDAPLELAIEGAAISLFANQGQTCASGSRVLVHRDILDEVAGRLTEAARSLVVGDPFDPATQMGSLVNARQLDRVLAYVGGARAEGATVLTGGRRLERPGFFMEPTLVMGHNRLTLAREEVFGPVGLLVPFDDDEEAIALANDTDYGLTSVLWTRDVSAVNRFARALKAGSTWVNAWGPPHPALPWLGIRQSGLGEELGRQGLLSNTVEKVVSVVSAG
jgi:acyl-CoA reductase-like NAD-dependent aldehyde dehydrogenase